MAMKIEKQSQSTTSNSKQLLVAAILVVVGLIGLYTLNLSFQSWDDYQTNVPASQFCVEMFGDKKSAAIECIGSVFDRTDNTRIYAQTFAIVGGLLSGVALTGLVTMLIGNQASTRKAAKKEARKQKKK